MVCPEGKKTAL